MSPSAEDFVSWAKSAGASALGKMPVGAAESAAGLIGEYEIDGYVLDPHIRLAMKTTERDQSIHTMTPAHARRASAAGFRASNAPRVDGVSVSPTVISDPIHGDLPGRVYEPSQTAEALRPGVLFLHQGGSVIGDLETCDTFCTQLAAGLGAVVVSLDYLLAPEHQFPTQNDNVDAAWDWLLDSARYLSIDTSQLVVCGDSAGGQLTASLCQRLRDAERPQPAVQALIYPFVDAAATGGSMESCADAFPLTIDIAHFFTAQLVPDGFDREDPSFSPAQHLNLAGLAPAVVVTAAFDILRDQGVAYGDKLREAGVPVISRIEETMPHSFLAMGGLSPEAYAASERVIADISTLLTKAGE